MYNIGTLEYLVKKDKVEMITDYIEEYIGLDYEVVENKIIIAGIPLDEHMALRRYISKTNSGMR